MSAIHFTSEGSAMKTSVIYQALVESYWVDPWPPHMALAAVAATGVQDADTVVLTRIISRHLAKPDFNAMAREVTINLCEAR